MAKGWVGGEGWKRSVSCIECENERTKGKRQGRTTENQDEGSLT